MKDDLHITLVQSNLYWENSEANRGMFSEKIASIHQPVDLILLPEMFTTGFSMNPSHCAETMNGPAMQWMKELAKKKNSVICGSLMMRVSSSLQNDTAESYYNRLIWMRPDGSFEYYDKRHLFGLGEEHNHYSSGDKKIVTELKGWKILPLICYDLRFPAWSRNTDREPYDVLIYVANWPDRRIHAWKTLLEARAIENQCYVIGVNRTGNDVHDVFYPGESSVIDPKGEIFWREANRECSHTCTLSYHHLNHIRETLPFLKDQDKFEIK